MSLSPSLIGQLVRQKVDSSPDRGNPYSLQIKMTSITVSGWEVPSFRKEYDSTRFLLHEHG